MAGNLRIRRIWRVRLAGGARWVEVGLAVAGEIDLTTADQLRDRLAAALARHPARFELNLEHVAFADSQLVHILVQELAVTPPTRLRVTGCRPQVARLLEVCGLSGIVVPFQDTSAPAEEPSARCEETSTPCQPPPAPGETARGTQGDPARVAPAMRSLAA